MAATLTVMFTDLVGSTALMSRVGEETAETLRLEHFELLRAGFVDRNGREVKNLGDGLLVVFDSAVDAVAAGAAIQQGFDKRNRHADEPLEIRVAIAVGDVDVDESGDVFGAPVVQAARLCGVAEGGEVLCTDLTRLLTGSRLEIDFEAVGDLELKGLEGPVPTSRVCWEPLDAGAGAALPPRLVSSLAPTFVGRTAEADQILGLYKEASTGATRRVALLAGEPGIGKTTLTAQVTAELADRGATVVYGRSDDGLGVSYQPWIEALDMLLDAVDGSVLSDHVADRGPSLARLVPRLAAKAGVEVPSGEVGESERFVLFGCVTDLLMRAAAIDPVVLVLDDLHWTDRQSLHLLRHVVTSGEPMRLVVIGTFRDSEVQDGDPLSDLLAVFHRESGVQRIPLTGFGDQDLLELLERTAGHEMDDDGLGLRDAVLAETAGNPFFVGEILRHLRDIGAMVQDETGHWVGTMDLAEVGLPVSVTEVVGQRIGALGEETRKLLSAAAVMGRDFDIETLSVVADIDEDTVIDLCDAAVDASVLATTDQVGVYTFAHALIGHTLTVGLSATRRARMHRTIAEVLEGSGDATSRAGELANHWANAVNIDTDKVVTYELLAGRQALERVAPDDAVDWFTRALDHHDHGDQTDEGRRLEILIELGEAQKLSGRGDYRATLLEASAMADRLDRPDLLVRAVLLNSRGWQSNIDATDHERIQWLDRALSVVDDDTDRAMLLVPFAMERLYEAGVDERVALVREAIELTESAPPDVRAQILVQAARAVPDPATLADRSEWCAEVGAHRDELTDTDLACQHLFVDVGLALEVGDTERNGRGLVAIDSMLARTADAQKRWTVTFYKVIPAILSGELDAAAQTAEQALHLGTDYGVPDAFSIYGAQHLCIQSHRGLLAELVPTLEGVVAEHPDRAIYRAVLARAAALAGDFDRTRQLIELERAAGFAMQEGHMLTTSMANWTQAIVTIGDVDIARLLRERLEPFADHVVTTLATIDAAMAYWLGCLDHLLGDLDAADGWFAAADAVHRRMGSPLLTAYSDAAWAAVLAERGRDDDGERARELARSALDVADERGFAHIATDARAVLDRL